MLSSLTSRLLLALSFAATTYASDRVINVPLTDPSIILEGHTYYNASLCGGGISLPNVGDSLAYSFNGSDIQLDFVVVPGEDFGNFTAWPDGAAIGSGYPLWWGKPETLNCSFRDSTSFSSSANYQLRRDLHTLNLTNAGNSKGGGGIFVVGISYFPDPLEFTSEIWVPASERRRGSHIGERTVIFAATFSSVVGLSLLACLVGYLRHRHFKKRNAKKAAAGSVEMDDLGSDADQKQTAPKPRSRASRWVESLAWAAS